MTHPTRFDRTILLVAAAVQTVGLGTVVALLADLQDAYGFESWGLGLIGGIAFGASFVSYLTLSRLADRGHAKRMLVLGSLGAGAGLVWAAFGTSLWSLVAARALFGLAEGAAVPAARRIMLDWSPHEPGKELGRLISASVSGFVIGPLAGAVLAENFGLRVPFLAPAVLLAVTLPFLFRITPHPVSPVDTPKLMRSLVGNRAVWAAVALGVGEFFAIGAFDAVWARFMTDRGASTTLIGVSFAAFVIPIAVSSIWWGRLADRRAPMSVGFVAAGAALIPYAMYGVLTEPWHLIGLSAVHGTVTAGIQPAAAAAVARATPRDLLATGQGMLEAVGFLAAAVAALPAGWLYGSLGPRFTFGIVAAGTAVCLVIAAVLHRGSDRYH